MDHFIKVAIGAIVILGLSLLSKSRWYLIAGFLPLIPVFAIISQFFIYSDRGVYDLKKTILICILSLIPYFAYLVSMYFMVDRMRFGHAIMGSLMVWALLSSPLIFFNSSLESQFEKLGLTTPATEKSMVATEAVK
tara:strand:+ start:5660 stop:6067 length:408 start_codon:yes stop_codon:yes gene_type:complete